MKDWTEAELATVVAEVQAREGTLTRWRAPLVAYASADDPLFPQLKQDRAPNARHAAGQRCEPDGGATALWSAPM